MLDLGSLTTSASDEVLFFCLLYYICVYADLFLGHFIQYVESIFLSHPEHVIGFHNIHDGMHSLEGMSHFSVLSCQVVLASMKV